MTRRILRIGSPADQPSYDRPPSIARGLLIISGGYAGAVHGATVQRKPRRAGVRAGCHGSIFMRSGSTGGRGCACGRLRLPGLPSSLGSARQKPRSCRRPCALAVFLGFPLGLLGLVMHGLEAPECSHGTMRYVCLAIPDFLFLNAPDNDGYNLVRLPPPLSTTVVSRQASGVAHT